LGKNSEHDEEKQITEKSLHVYDALPVLDEEPITTKAARHFYCADFGKTHPRARLVKVVISRRSREIFVPMQPKCKISPFRSR
jgi:hypothetical protein